MTCHEMEVREGAYFLWESAGKPEGRDLELWCAAERWIEATLLTTGMGRLIAHLKRCADPKAVIADYLNPLKRGFCF